jgi:hypothetical protein
MLYENGKNTFAEKQFPHTTGALLTATINSIKSTSLGESFRTPNKGIQSILIAVANRSHTNIE